MPCMGSEAIIDNEQFVRRIKAGEDVADNMLRLWQQNEGFIAMLAMRHRGYAEQEDLRQEGYIGLCEAVRQYDPSKGVPFINYAAFWIRHAMRRYISNCCGTIRLLVHAREWIGRYRQAVREYESGFGEAPSEVALCALLGVSRERLQAVQESVRLERVGSMSEPVQNDSGLTLEETLPSGEDLEEDAIERMDRQEMSRDLWGMVDRLPADQKAVVRGRYQDRRTLREIGEGMGVSEPRIRGMEQKAMRTLRRPGNCERLRGYYEEYISASPIHHVGLERFQSTWVSAVEWEAFRHE